ncbi:CHRD domain-containing protein [Armatimonas sp.]|uniref:CHRD domain-containing protein n=1 Tax=Armatimonas sp. TaxID=1872638 RepID=UPI00286D61CF|nr:CHRD domain-containing protein [Armatimonas sp.]
MLNKSKLILGIALLSGLALMTRSAQAAGPGDVFVAPISGAFEVPANASTALGTAVLTVVNVDDFQLVVNFTSVFSANVTAAHIHLAPPGVNGGVVVNLATAAFVGARTITGTTNPSISGTYTGQAAFITALGTGTHYINFHNAPFPGGEARGNFAAAPEPGTVALGVLGLGALAIARRRRGQ